MIQLLYPAIVKALAVRIERTLPSRSLLRNLAGKTRTVLYPVLTFGGAVLSESRLTHAASAIALCPAYVPLHRILLRVRPFVCKVGV